MLKKHTVVPDVISKPPEKRIKVVFDSGVEVRFNQILKIKTNV
jgi:hypothetical protein